MLTIDSIIGRLKGELGATTDASVARALKVSRNAPATWRKRGTIPVQELAEFAKRERYNLGWLLDGQGEAKIDIVREPAKSRTLQTPILDIHLLIEAITLARSVQRVFTNEQFAELVGMIYVYVGGDDDSRPLTVDDSKIIQFADIASRRHFK